MTNFGRVNDRWHVFWTVCLLEPARIQQDFCVHVAWIYDRTRILLALRGFCVRYLGDAVDFTCSAVFGYVLEATVVVYYNATHLSVVQHADNELRMPHMPCVYKRPSSGHKSILALKNSCRPYSYLLDTLYLPIFSPLLWPTCMHPISSGTAPSTCCTVPHDAWADFWPHVI